MKREKVHSRQYCSFLGRNDTKKTLFSPNTNLTSRNSRSGIWKVLIRTVNHKEVVFNEGIIRFVKLGVFKVSRSSWLLPSVSYWSYWSQGELQTSASQHINTTHQATPAGGIFWWRLPSLSLETFNPSIIQQAPLWCFGNTLEIWEWVFKSLRAR